MTIKSDDRIRQSYIDVAPPKAGAELSASAQDGNYAYDPLNKFTAPKWSTATQFEAWSTSSPASQSAEIRREYNEPSIGSLWLVGVALGFALGMMVSLIISMVFSVL